MVALYVDGELLTTTDGLDTVAATLAAMNITEVDELIARHTIEDHTAETCIRYEDGDIIILDQGIILY